MKIYLTNTGTLKHIEIMISSNHTVGNMLLANNFRVPKSGVDWALDNGAYHAYLNKESFDEISFRRTINRIDEFPKPDFIVVPDIVAGGMNSLDFSLQWLKELPDKYDYFIPVQDGMDVEVVKEISDKCVGIFIGGTMAWKFRVGREFADMGKRLGLAVHIGRIGTYSNLIWANSIGASSVDSCNFNRNGKMELLETWKKQMVLA